MRLFGGRLGVGLLLIPVAAALAAPSPGSLGASWAAVAVAMAVGLAGAILANIRAPRHLIAPGQPPNQLLVALVAGLALLAAGVAVASRFAPGQTSWILLATALVATGLREPRALVESHLLWAVALTPLVGVGWVAAGGGGPLPGALLAWAILGQLGQGFSWMASEARTPPLPAWRGAMPGRVLELGSPFALLGLMGGFGLGATFLAGLALAGLLGAAGRVWPGEGMASARTIAGGGAALGRLTIMLAILLDRAGWPS